MEKLRKLEATGEYLFHGSATKNIEVLKPRQAISFNKPHGEPAASASDAVDPAVFMAVLGSRRTGGWGKKDGGGSYGFYILDTDMQRAQEENWHGFVYILDRNGFEHFHDHEWRSVNSAAPIKSVQVGLGDLTNEIEIMDRGAFEAYLDAHK